MKTSEHVHSSAPHGKRKLNVVFHGLWAWEALGDQILAHTPIEPEHQIALGDFQQQTAIPENTHCKLRNVDPGDMNEFEVEQNLLVTNRSILPDAKRHCVVELPLPRKIRSVRRVPVKTEEPFKGRDGEELHPNEVTMVQVFIYEVDHLDSVTIEPDALAPGLRINPGGRTANLHFFAQPPGGHHHDQDGAVEAYKKMAAMFDLEIIPYEPLFVTAQDPGIEGLTKEDMRFLGESDPAPPHPHGRTDPQPPHPHGRGFALPRLRFDSSGVNCDGLVVDNRYFDTSSTSSSY